MKPSELKTEDGYECPTCGKNLNTSLGVKQHHTKVHDESIVETVECIWCGDEFRKKPSQPGRFCSRECFGEHRSDHGIEARKRRTLISCANCREVFATRRSTADGRRYCSEECRYDDSGAEWQFCEVCGDKYRAHATLADKRRFCSQNCYGEWLSENRSGEHSQHWKGDERVTGRPDYGPGWGEQKREHIRRRDGRECQDCGMANEDHLLEYGCRLNVHHIVPARQATNPAVYNAPRNLVTLCVACHMTREQANP